MKTTFANEESFNSLPRYDIYDEVPEHKVKSNAATMKKVDSVILLFSVLLFCLLVLSKITGF